MIGVSGVSGPGQGHAAQAVQASFGLEVASKVQGQQKQEGEAAESLIEGAGEVSEEAPPTGDSTGQHVNLFA